MMTALLSVMNCLTTSSGRAARSASSEVEEHRAGDRQRSDGDEDGDRDRRVGPVEPGLGDGRGGGEREREVLRVRPGERRTEHHRLRRRRRVDRGHPRRRLRLPAVLRPLAPLPGGHDEEQQPEGDLEPGDARVVAVGVAAGPEYEDHDDAHGEQPADPAERERGARAPGSRRSSTRTTATIGIGLRATASADGSRSPMTSLSTARQRPCASLTARPHPARRSRSRHRPTRRRRRPDSRGRARRDRVPSPGARRRAPSPGPWRAATARARR